MRIWKLVLVLFLAVTVSDVFTNDALARRGGGSRSGGSRSSGSSWGSKSSGSKTPSKSSGWGSRKSSTSTSRSNTTKSTTTTPKRSAADQKLHSKAAAQGTAFKSKSAATADFKTKHASKYTSKYDKEPATRPSHVPQTTTAGGNTYNVSYNSQHGGYGYMGPGGSWMMYDAMADAAMVSMLMSNRGYYYDQPVVATGGGVVVRRGPSPLMIFFIVCGVVALICVIGVAVNKYA